jgi:hypothetical protein
VASEIDNNSLERENNEMNRDSFIINGNNVNQA